MLPMKKRTFYALLQKQFKEHMYNKASEGYMEEVCVGNLKNWQVEYFREMVNGC